MHDYQKQEGNTRVRKLNKSRTTPRSVSQTSATRVSPLSVNRCCHECKITCHFIRNCTRTLNDDKDEDDGNDDDNDDENNGDNDGGTNAGNDSDKNNDEDTSLSNNLKLFFSISRLQKTSFYNLLIFASLP